MRFLVNILTLVTLIVSTQLKSQDMNSYNVYAFLDINNKTIEVSQKMKFKNTSNIDLEEIFLEDWSNSYINNETKLAKRISDEYSRSFTFAKKRQRGFTTVNEIKSNNIKSWNRLKGQSDIIRIELNKAVKINQYISIELKYNIKLPDSKFTGYGYDNENFYLKNWIIVFSNINQDKWFKQSNLNLDDQSLNESRFNLNFSYEGDYNLNSNLNKKEVNLINQINTVVLYGSGINNVRLNLIVGDVFRSLQNESVEIETDIFKISSVLEADIKFNRVSKFVTNYFDDSDKFKLLIPKTDYESSPFYGLNQLPRFISPFSDKFLEEIVFLKSFVKNYLNLNINLNKRESHWLYNGLEIFLINKYISKYYPDVKFLGRLSRFRLIKNYEISKINFNDLFLNYSEYVQRLNLHQLDDQSSEFLTRINEEISSPYHSGVGLIYIENIIGDTEFKKLIKNLAFIDSRIELNNLFINYPNADLSWFIHDYIGKRQSIDLKIKKIGTDNFIVSEKNNIELPYSIGLLKNDSIVYSKMFYKTGKIELPEIDFDYVSINPVFKLPEFNRNNNWLYSKSKSNLKPLKLKFIGDLENPKYRSIYYRPEITYNLYDGLSPGINLINRGLKNRPLSFEIFTQYASKEETLVGSMNFRYQIDNEITNNYLTLFNFYYNSNHYNENLRYQVFSPSIQINFRDNKNLRSNIRKSISLSMFSVNKENNNANKNSLNKYSIFNLGYYYSDIGIIKYLKTSINTEFSDNFGKINLIFDYRKLFNSNRQFQARIYLGKFFWNNDQFNNFKYNLGRSGGYLFLDNYLGRSERTGLLSQQFIMAGGGFKSLFENPTTNNFMLTSNLNIGIWKWVEGYLDLGMLKNKDANSRYFYGTGLRLNLLPDFFELYFPVSSSNGFELNDFRYYNKIRFIVSYNLESLGKLFSRRWL
tara:strand:+ start:5161 stop:7941 length:2781 start_codon:yes stop_codon:yes gene_type:complete